MSPLETAFWSCLALVLYAYAGYPLLVALLSRLRPPAPRRAPCTDSVSIILPAHNEELSIERRLRELRQQLRSAGVGGEIIVVSDGSTDGTAQRARASDASYAGGDHVIHVIELAENRGKSAAVYEGALAARHDILVFADARQRWGPDTLTRLLENFADPGVGAVSGDLDLQSAPGVLAGVGLYWRYEKWLRRQESRLHSVVGVTGAIAAARRAIYQPAPPGTVLDDVYWPLRVALSGGRVIHDERAKAFDRLPERTRDEFRRKVRTLSGNFQLLTRLPAALVPGLNPVWWQYVSHKLLRLAVPWALIALVALSALLPGPIYQGAFWAQTAFYALGVTGLWPALSRRVSPAATAGSFLVLNAAAWLAFWVWLSGRAGQAWCKVRYRAPPTQLAAEGQLFVFPKTSEAFQTSEVSST